MLVDLYELLNMLCSVELLLPLKKAGYRVLLMNFEVKMFVNVIKETDTKYIK